MDRGLKEYTSLSVPGDYLSVSENSANSFLRHGGW
jgi:hypothetical protein